MRILLAGAWEWGIYEEASARALVELGNEVHPFAFKDFFAGRWGRYQSALATFRGPAAASLNRALIQAVRRIQPTLLLAWRAVHVWPDTLRAIRAQGCHLVSYNNDDPFAPTRPGVPWHHRFLWKWYLAGLAEYDANFVYRPANVAEAAALGARNVAVLMPYFISDRHHPVVLSAEERRRFGCEAVFVGHYEPDGRIEYLRALVHAGVDVKLFGGVYWTERVLGDLAAHFGPVQPAEGADYARALGGAKMCLAFLSRINRDVYTRRCFEIPACGRPLVCERTEELRRLFREDEEAIFFSSPAELVEKVLWYRDRPGELERIAAGGMHRVIEDGHDVRGRMREMLEKLERFRAANHEATAERI